MRAGLTGRLAGLRWPVARSLWLCRSLAFAACVRASRLCVLPALRRRVRDLRVCVLCVRRRGGVVSMCVGGRRPVAAPAVVTFIVVLCGLWFGLGVVRAWRLRGCDVCVFLGLCLLGDVGGRVCR